jgi:hypothetical protein
VIVRPGGSWNGWAYGPGTYFGVAELEGAYDFDGVRADNQPVSGRDGTRRSLSTLDARTVTLKLALNGSGPGHLDDLRSELIAVTPPKVEGLLVLPGGRWQMYAECRKRNLPLDLGRMARTAYGTLEFYCWDPVRYRTEVRAETARLPMTSGIGLVPPLAPPLGFPAGASGDAVMFNEGNVPVAVNLRINGPLTNPTVTVPEFGGVLQCTASIPAGSWYDVDCAEMTVRLNGLANRRSDLQPGHIWPWAPKGYSTWQLRATGGTGTMDISFRAGEE